MKILVENKPEWVKSIVRIIFSFSREEIRFKVSESSDFIKYENEWVEWAKYIYNNIEDTSNILRCQIDPYSKKASFTAGSNKNKRIVLVEELPPFLTEALPTKDRSTKDRFERFCNQYNLYYDFTNLGSQYLNNETNKAYTIFKYSSDWRQSK